MLRSLHKLLSKSFIAIGLLCGLQMLAGRAMGQGVFYTENMGSPSTTTAVGSFTGWQVPGVSFSGSADVRTTSASSGYTGASGSGNIFITTTVGQNVVFSGINTLGYSSISMQFGLSKQTTSGDITDLQVSVSTDGTSWSAVTFASSTTSGWRLVTVTGGASIPSTANLRIRFLNTTTTNQFRVDDVQLSGTPSQPRVTSVSNVFPIPGSSYTISGSNFNTTANNNKVFFGATRVVPSSASATSLTVSVPSGANFGPLSVTDTTKAMSGLSGFNSSSPIVALSPAFDTTGFRMDTISIRGRNDFTAVASAPALGGPYGAAIGDINGDGRADLVTINNDSASCTIFLNNSSGSTLTSSSFSFSQKLIFAGKTTNVKLVDMDGDGKLDIVATLPATSINVFRNTTTTPSSVTFAARQSIAVGTSGNSTVVAFADFNADGRIDLALSTALLSSVSVLTNTTQGTTISFSSALSLSGVSAGTPTGLYAADFDNDGLPDLVTSNSGFTGSSYAGTSISVFRNTSSSLTTSFATKSDFTTGTGPIDVIAADFDRDGKMDIAVTNTASNTFSVFRNTSSGAGSISFATKVDFSTGTNPVGIGVGDFNGDRNIDVVIANGTDNTISFFRNRTVGTTISFASAVTAAAGAVPNTVTTGDLDNDGFTDIVVGNRNSTTISVFENYPLPFVSAIGGTTNVCPTATTTLTNATSGGTWSSAAPTTATVNPSTGAVYGVAAGTTTITYTRVLGGDTNFVTTPFTVNALPIGGNITGTFTVCPGASSTLANSTASSGTVSWSTSNASIATVSSAGVVTGVAIGQAIITFTVTSSLGCGTATDTALMTVNSTPSAGTISGVASVCVGSTTSLSASLAGGTWSTLNAAVASVNTSGTVFGVSADTVTIVYTVTSGCGSASVSALITVNPLPATPASITGTTSACVGATTTLANTVSGGTWSSTNTAVATVNPSTGVVFGVSAGSATISYTISNSCGTNATTASITITGAPTVARTTGGGIACVGATRTVANTTSGGTWSSSSSSIATVNPSTGVVTGVAVGSAIITYSVVGTCFTTVDTTLITVLAPPSVAAITGTFNATTVTTATLSCTPSGGTWTTSNASIASVNSSTGVVKGVDAGIAIVTYTVTNVCGTGTDTALFTVTYPSITLTATADTQWNSIGSTSPDTSTFATVPGRTAPGIGTLIISNWQRVGATFQSTASVYNTTNFSTATSFATAITDNKYIYFTITNGSSTEAVVNRLILQGQRSNTGQQQVGVVYSSNRTGARNTQFGGIGVPTNGTPGTMVYSGSVCLAPGETDTFKVVPFDPATAGSGGGTYRILNGTSLNFAYTTGVNTYSIGSVSNSSPVCAGSNLSFTGSNAVGAVGPFSYSWSGPSSYSSTATSPTITAATTSAAGVYTFTGTDIFGCAIAATTTATVNASPSPGNVTGAMSACVGATSTLANGTASAGTVSWSTSNASIASVNSSTGVVSAVSAGQAIITYSVTNASGCSSIDTALFTVITSPSAGTISGTTTVCAAATTSLTASGVGGGTWLSTNTSIATVSASGVVTGVASGSATISYTVSNSCGSNSATATVTVNPLPATPAAITGTTTACVGATTTLSNTVAGGTWSTTNAAVASVDASGVVYGASAGTATISYAISNSCGSNAVATTVTINTTPTVADIAGAGTICPTYTLSLTNSTSGGTWGSSDPTIATVNSTTGVVTGVATGVAVITYTVTTSCGTATDTALVTISSTPSAGSISGASAVCVAATTTLSASVVGGTWSSSDNTIATVNASGVVTGVAAGSVTISYSVTNSCGTAVATSAITVNPLPTTPAAIGGTTSACIGATTTLSNTVSGGTWSTASVAIASVNPTTGVVFGVSAGSTNITYTITNSCGSASVNTSVTINTVPTVARTTGGGSVCISATRTVANTTSGGTWSSSSSSIATVNTTTGVVTGVAVGAAIITYSVTNSCGTSIDTTLVTVITVPSVAPITGTFTSTTTTSATLSATPSGGTWSSSNTAVATVNSTSGLVSGVGAGLAIITYTATNTCGSANDTALFTVTVGMTALADTQWNSIGSTSVDTSTFATVPARTSPGASVIRVSQWNRFGATYQATASVYNTTAFTPTTTFDSSLRDNKFIYFLITNNSSTEAVINKIKIVGQRSGTGPRLLGMAYSSSTVRNVQFGGIVRDTTFSTNMYFTGSVCLGPGETDTFKVYPYDPATPRATGGTFRILNGTALFLNYATGVSAIAFSATSNSPVCEGTSLNLNSGTVSGGISPYTYAWTGPTSFTSTSSTPTRTSVTSGAAGTYSLTVTDNFGCSATNTTSVTVTPLPATPATIGGTASACVGTSSTLTNSVAGGTWSSSNTSVATVSTSGVVTGVATGTASISYTISNTCGSNSASVSFTVNPALSVSPISGVDTVCVGSSTAFSNATSGGTWSTSAASIASVDVSGTVVGVASGLATITYSISGACGTAFATKAVRSSSAPSLGGISGITSVCVGATSSLSVTPSGGTWSMADPVIATVDATSGVITGVGAGTTIVSYSLSNLCGSSVQTASVTVTAAPGVATISGAGLVCIGTPNTLSTTVAGGTWSISSASIATISSSGVVNGVSIGTAIVTYDFTSACGSTSDTMLITVNSAPALPTISGVSAHCAGTTTTLTPSVSGGSWSSGATSIATVSTTGLVYGVAVGSATILYNVSNACGSLTATFEDTVLATPTVASITGTTSIIVRQMTTLANSTTGGTWSIASSSIASVTSTGTLIGVSNGSTTVSYSVTNVCGTATATAAVTVGQAFGQGNLVVLQVNDTVNTGSSVSVVEYATTGGSAIRSVSLPSTGSSPRLIASGTATSEGHMSLDSERVRIVIPGYDTSIASVSASVNGVANVRRSIFTLGANLTPVNVARVRQGRAFNANNMRGATGAGNSYFATGTSATVNNAGVQMLLDTNATQIFSAQNNTRTCQVFNGQLYMATGSGTRGVYQIGSNTPRTGVVTGTLIHTNPAGVISSPYAFSISPDNLTMYIADDAGGIYRLTRTTTTDSFRNLTTINSTTVRGLVVDYTTTPNTLYAVTATGTRRCTSCNAYSDSLLRIVDNGAGSSATVVAVAPANTNFRSVSFTPTPSAKIIATTAAVCSGTRDSLILFGNPGATVSYTINGGARTATLDATGRQIILDTTVTNTSGSPISISYSLTSIATSVGTFLTTGSGSITVNPGATATLATGSTTICSGSSATISVTGTPGALVTVTPGSSTFTIGGGGTGSLAIARTTDTVFTARVSVGSCSYAVAGSYSVTVVGLPTASISGSTSIILGASATLALTGTPSAVVYFTRSGISGTDSFTLSSGGSYTWSVSPTVTTTYTVTGVRSSGGCFTSITGSSAIVNVTTLPTASISGSDTLCAGASDTIFFAGTGGARVRYTAGSLTDSVTLSGDSTTTGTFALVVSPSTSTTYTLVSITSGVYTGSLSGSATMVVIPSISAGTISGASSVCLGSSISLTSSGTVGGTWSSSSSAIASVSTTGSVFGVAAGVATIKYRVSNRCFADSTTFADTVNALPTASISGSTSITPGGSAVLTVTGTPLASFVYTIAGSSPTTASLSASGTYTVSVSPTVTTTYALTSVTSVAGCVATLSSSAVVTVTQPFSRFNLVVNRIGNGTTTLSGDAFPVRVVEYTTSGTATGAFTNLPSSSGIMLTESGTATSNGYMGLDSERINLVITGYNAPSGTASINGAAGVRRVVFSIPQSTVAANVANVSQSFAFGGNNIRSGTAAGGRYYIAGNGSPTVTGGIQMMGSSILGSDTLSRQITRLPQSNTRVTGIFNGQLYYTSAPSTPTSARGVYRVGSGIPTDTANVATQVAYTGLSVITSPYGFSFSPDNRTMYISDDDGTTGGILKFTRPSSDTGSYAFQYRVTTTTTRSLAVDYTTTPFTIYATTASGTSNNSIIRISDTGASSAATTIASAGTNYIFRGLAFSPAPYAKINGTIPTVCAGTSDTVIFYANPGAKVYYTVNNATNDSVTIGNTGMRRFGTGPLSNGTPSPVTYTYKITGVVTSSGLTSLTDSTTITVNPLPYLAPITGVTTVCAGGAITVADTAVGGTWASSDTTIATISSAGVVSTLAAGTTTISYSKTNSCGTSTVTAPLVVNAIPTAGGITPSFVAGCTGSTLTLSQTGTASGPGAITAYNWAGPGSYSATTTYASDSFVVSSASASGIYSLTVTYSGAGCTSAPVTTASVTITAPPSVYLVTGGGSYCSASAVALGLSGSQSGVNYQLYRGSTAVGSPVAGTGSAISFPSSSVVGAYTVVGTSTIGCESNMSGTAYIVDNTVSVSLVGFPSICSPDTTALVSYGSAVGTPTTFSVSWSTAASSAGFVDVASGTLGSSTIALPVPAAVAAGVYTGSVTVSNGFCTSTPAVATVSVYSMPSASITASSLAPCVGRSVSVTVSGTPGANFTYKVNSGSAITALIPGAGTYSITASAVTDTVAYTLIDVYNFACSTSYSSTITLTPLPMRWVGGTSGAATDWHTGSNWSCGSVPTVSDNPIVPATSNQPIITATANARNLTVQSAATIRIDGSHVLNIKGNLSNNGRLFGSGTAMLNATSAQRITGIGTINRLELNNGDSATIDTGSRVTIDSVLTLTSGSLYTNDSLVIASTAALRNARVAPIATGSAIVGKARVFVGIPGGMRRWRFLAHQFSDTLSFGQVQQYIDITGPGGASNGFTTTTTNAPSAYRYTPIGGNSAAAYDPGWRVISRISATTPDSNKFQRYQGVRLFMRGRKGEGLGYGTYIPSATAIGQFGNLNQGRQVVRMVKGSSSLQDYNLLGNPYAAPVDLGTVAYQAKASGNILGSMFYVWKASLYTGGAFVGIPIGTGAADPYYLQSGGAFEVRAANNGDSLVFNESHKGTAESDYLMKPQTEVTVLNVYDENDNLADIMRFAFQDGASDNEDNLDARKLMNPDLSFYSFSADGYRQTMDVRSFETGKVIPLGITASHTDNLVFRADNVSVPAGNSLYLRDKWLNTYTELTQGTEYHFSITKDKSSQGDNRFELAMKPASSALATGMNVSMSPNPASQEVALSFTMPTAEDVNVRVMDMNGVSVFVKNLGVKQTGTVQVPVSRLAAGIYMVELTSGSNKVVKRLVKE